MIAVDVNISTVIQVNEKQASEFPFSPPVVVASVPVIPNALNNSSDKIVQQLATHSPFDKLDTFTYPIRLGVAEVFASMVR